MTQSKSDLIAQDIASKIRFKQYSPGEYLPSESQLTTLYGSSRETVRKALEQLTSLGMIQKIKGKGSIVLDLEKYSFPLSGITSFSELNKSLAMNAKTQVLKLEKMKDLPVLFKKKFPTQEKQSGIYVERLRLIDNQPQVLDCDYLFTPPIEKLPKEAAESSIYEYLENKLGLEISYATKEITVEKVNAELQDKLKIPDDVAVLVASHNFLNDTTLFQLTLSFHNPAKFKFVDFARRQKIQL
ncbi:trehalose operon repressor [Lactobacillus sp. LL6]|uniref:trehalose operon repressor n=1 Tax=Lactobacillus sp. LL6 TaxID=2596827 RepID=UPI001184708A|nr:trehalose operon repressor [Lactobacillus sp. LL6]TSO25468.1 trehalose operon repressor [Lactobacillus sp. LL6]